MARGVKGTGPYSKHRYTKQEAKYYNWSMALFCAIVVVVFVAAGA